MDMPTSMATAVTVQKNNLQLSLGLRFGPSGLGFGLYCTVLYCAVLYCTVLYCIVLYCTVLKYTVKYFILLYFCILDFILY